MVAFEKKIHFLWNFVFEHVNNFYEIKTLNAILHKSGGKALAAMENSIKNATFY